jgi:hypothetical protein
VYVAASASFEAVFESGITGLVGSVEVTIIDNEGNVVLPSSAAGITEQIIDGNPDSGVYATTLTAPVDPGQYTIVWSTDGTYDFKTVTVEDLVVVAIGVIVPPVGPPSGVGQTSGPCSLWTNIDQIAACCTTIEGEDEFVTIAKLTQAAEAASRTLWQLSGRLFSGACQKRVHICGNLDGCFQVLSRGHIVGNMPSYRHAFEVRLDGYPVREVTEVKVGGDVLDPSSYRLENWRWLVRTDGLPWPTCRGPVADLEDNSALYTYGQDPPITAQLAAAQLACEAYKQCAGANDCLLPSGATRVTRQGITIEMSWMSYDRSLRAWKSGLGDVDAFLNAENPSRLQRRPSISSPDIKYAREIT